MIRSRTALARKTVSEVDVARYEGVTLAGTVPEGTAQVGDLCVVVDAAGISVLGPAPEVVRTVTWDRVSSLAMRPALVGAGRPATALEVGLGSRFVEVLFPSDSYDRDAVDGLARHTTAVSGFTVATVAPAAAPLSVPDTDQSTESARADGWQPPSPVDRPRRTGKSRRPVVAVVVLVLVAGLAGGWYYVHRSSTPSTPAAPTASALVENTVIATSAGIHPGDLAGWTHAAGNLGNPFASGATTSPTAAAAAAHAGSALAQCMGVPVSDVDGAFGIGSAPGRVAQAQSLLFSQAGTTGATASSSVAVMASAGDVSRDASVFGDATALASCLQRFEQAMLAYVPVGTSGETLSAVTVEPDTVALPTPPTGVHEAAFSMARTGQIGGQSVTQTTDAIAVFGGRVQATVTTTSNAAIDATTEGALVGAVEARVAGDLHR